MTLTTVTVTAATCDACGTTRMAPSAGTQPPGYHGVVNYYPAGEGDLPVGASFYAEKIGCVRRAMDNALDLARADCLPPIPLSSPASTVDSAASPGPTP